MNKTMKQLWENKCMQTPA